MFQDFFIPHTYTQNSLHFNSPFQPLHFYPFIYILPIALHAIHIKYTQTKNDVIYLQSFDDTYLALTYIVVLSNPNLHELATTKEGRLVFYIKWQWHYDFDVKVGRCGFVDFVNDVIDCGCLTCIFCFRINEIEKDTFYINFYSIIFLQSCFVFFFLISCCFNWIIVIDMCVQFIIVAFYDELITNKVLQQLCYNIYIYIYIYI